MRHTHGWRRVALGLLALGGWLSLGAPAAAQSGPTYTDVVLRVEGDHFAVRKTTTGGAVTDGPRFLVMVSYYDALAALEAGVLDSDLDYLAYTLQVDGIRLFPNWWVVDANGCVGGDATRTVMSASGALNGDDPEGPVGRLEALLTVLKRARQRGLVVDVSLARETVPGLTPAGFTAGVARLATFLRPYRHVLLDLQNEWDVHGLSVADVTALRAAVTTVDPGRIVVASATPSGTAAVAGAGLSALAVHDPRVQTSPGAWWEAGTVTGVVTALRAVAPLAPIYFQEPMPWSTGRVWCGQAEPNPKDADGDPAHFRTAALAAKTAGAAAWTFHTRQSFDLGASSLRSRIQSDAAEVGLLEGSGGLAATTAASPTWPVQAALEVLRGGMGDGTVTGPGGLSCGAVCTGTFPIGTVVTLNAVPATGQVFAGWSGVPGCTTALSCIVELTGSTTVTATFGAALAEPVVTFAHADTLGTLRVVTDTTGAVVRRHDLLPFGEAWASPVPPVDRAIFTGQERDTETGLDYFGARYYRSDTGRFTTIDPLFTWKENLEDPQRWNRYAYGRNNPLRYVDPDGRDIRVTLYVGQNGNLFGHIGVGVNSPETYGLEPEGPTSSVLKGETVEGKVQLDTSEIERTVLIPTTAAEDEAAERFLADSRESNQKYNLLTRNCADFVREVLAAAGIKTPDVAKPSDMFSNAQIEADKRTAPEKRKSNFIVRALLAIMGDKEPR